MNSTRCSERPTKTAENALMKVVESVEECKDSERGIVVAEVIVSRTTQCGSVELEGKPCGEPGC